MPARRRRTAELVRQPVESSMMRSVGYDAERRILEIEFHDGRVYRYEQVPPEVFADLLRAPSLGRYFQAEIRDVYPSERVR